MIDSCRPIISCVCVCAPACVCARTCECWPTWGDKRGDLLTDFSPDPGGSDPGCISDPPEEKQTHTHTHTHTHVWTAVLVRTLTDITLLLTIKTKCLYSNLNLNLIVTLKPSLNPQSLATQWGPDKISSLPKNDLAPLVRNSHWNLLRCKYKHIHTHTHTHTHTQILVLLDQPAGFLPR